MEKEHYDTIKKARNDKNFDALIIIRRGGKEFFRMIIKDRASRKYAEHDNRLTDFIAIDIPTIIKEENFGGYKAKEICFHESNYGHRNHCKTFLKAIKPNSEVIFRVIAHNNHDHAKERGYEIHELYGEIDGNAYLLSKSATPTNSASPVKEHSPF